MTIDSKKDCCIYVLCDARAFKNKVFYIGKSTNSRISKRILEHNCDKKLSHKRNKIASIKLSGSSFECKIVKSGLTEDEAYLLEKKLIKFLKYNCGFQLTNGNDGGRGGRIGLNHSEENLLKFASQKIGIKNGMFGMTGSNNPAYGKKISEETRLKIKEKRKYQTRTKTKIYLFDRIGRYKIFESINSFAREFGITKIAAKFFIKNNSIGDCVIAIADNVRSSLNV